MLFDGQPFSRETVSCWLQCCSSSIYGAAALDSNIISMLSTVMGLAQVLAFAQAVGCFTGTFQAACSQLQQLKLFVQLPEQVLELPVVGCSYTFDDTQLVRYTGQRALVGAPLVFLEQRRDLQQQVAKQLSALLRLAHALRLQPLLDVLHRFLMTNCGLPSHRLLLSGVTGLVFSDAVFEAALGSSTLSKEAYISTVMSLPCSLTPDVVGHGSLLKPVGEPRYLADEKVLAFYAQLLRDFLEGKAGATVKVHLNLFSGVIKLQLAPESGFLQLPAQLLLGRTFSEGASLDGFLSGNPAA